MAHAVVAVDQRHGGALLDHADLGPDVDAAGLDALHVLRQADERGRRALRVSLGHQPGDANHAIVEDERPPLQRLRR